MKGRNYLLFIIITEFIILVGLCGYRIYQVADKNEEVKYYTVIFETDNGEKIDNLDVLPNTKIELPNNLIKDGFVFEGWLVNDEIYNGEYIVENNVTIKAVWTDKNSNMEKYYTVVFNDGTNIVKDTKVKENSKIVFPKEPNKVGYIFDGWLIGDVLVDENYVVNEDITLKPKWLEKYYNISFDSNGGSEIEDIRVKNGSKVKLPNSYLRGYTFNGWLLDNQIIDENYEIKKDMNLKAKWQDNEDNNKEIVEYNFDKIEEFIDKKNSIKFVDKNGLVKYNDKDINIEVLFNNSDDSYVKVNGKTIENGFKFGASAIYVFKFNDLYVIEYSAPFHQCFNDMAIILNAAGEIIGKIGFEETLSRINYLKDKNQINVLTIKSCGLYTYPENPLTKEENYELIDNNLKLISSKLSDYYKTIYGNLDSEDKFSLKFEATSGDDTYTYNCVTNNCKAFDANSNNMLLYDNGYYLYNNDSKKLIEANDKKGALKYFDNKIIFYNEDEEMYYIYDENVNLITKINNEPYQIVVDNKKYYFTDTFVSKEKGSTVEVYNNEFKKLWIITGLSKNKNYVINSNNTITFNAEIDGIYVLFDSDMNLIHESKTYEMVGITENYIAVIDKNKLKILDLNENIVVEFDYLPNAYKFDNFYADESSGNITISAHDYENDKYVYYYYNLNTGEKSIKK